jgi:hypothetical protein
MEEAGSSNLPKPILYFLATTSDARSLAISKRTAKP